MYTVYLIFTIILIISFITGNVVLIAEHKFKRDHLVLKKGLIVDEEIL